jgi:hypothetical protein
VPVVKSEDVIERIIEAVSNGTPLAEVLREKWAPHHSTFYDWLNNDPDLDRRFARAREIGHDVIAANARNVARGKRGSSKDVKRDRLIVDTDLKLLEKWDRRYRPAQVLAGDPEAPLFPQTQNIDLGETLVALLGVALARRETALREGLTGRLSSEQFDYLVAKHPSPPPVPLRTYREGWTPAHTMIDAKPIDRHDGSDLA